MAHERTEQDGPDLSQGVPLADLAEGGKLAGRCGKDQVLVVRRGTEIFAVDAHCTHYSGPLAEGLVVDDTVRCPWHHACFSLRTGEAIRAPAFRPLARWKVEQRDGKVYVTEKLKRAQAAPSPAAREGTPERIVIIGGGAAGFAAAEMLRRERYEGSLTMVSDDDAAPVDRPNLSKDYLAGTAQDDWIPMRPESFYAKNNIDLRLKANVVLIDPRAREIILASGDRLSYSRLLLAMGAEPVRLSIPGADLPHVHVLRSFADSQAIIAGAKSARRAIVLGASFIGLEVAAALRTRGLEIHVVAPDKRPLERILGPQLGDFIRALHEQNGVVFHLEQTVVGIDGSTAKLSGGGALEGDLVVAGVGVRPRTALAETAGLTLDRGVAVNGFLETSAPGVFAAGDIARWPDPHTGQNIRVEHWVVAQRQGQTAALNMLGQREAFTAVPFFWSQHYDTRINYAGHAEGWDKIDISGDVAARDCLLRYKRQGRTLAVASVSRDLDNLEAELAMERETAS